MIVITRNGRTTVLIGWRAALAISGMIVAAWAILAFIAFTIIGVAVTVGALLLAMVPAAIVAGLVTSLLRSPR